MPVSLFIKIELSEISLFVLLFSIMYFSEESSGNKRILMVSILFLLFLLVISRCSVVCSPRDITLLTFFLKHHLHQHQLQYEDWQEALFHLML